MIPLLFLAAYLTVRSAWRSIPHYIFVILMAPLPMIFLCVHINEKIVCSDVNWSPQRSRVSGDNQELVFDNAKDCSSVQVIRFSSINYPGEIFLNGIQQNIYKDYYYADFDKGSVYLLSRPNSIKEVTLKLDKPLLTADLVKADFIKLNWKFGVSPKIKRFFSEQFP
jgi:hypothetical protein